MRVEKTQNTQNFGMAYYLKASKNINNNFYQYYIASKQMQIYANLKSVVCIRGYKQFKQEMNQLYLYDVIFDHEDKSMKVIERATNKIIKSFDKSEKNGLDYKGAKKFPGRKIFAYLFNPKKFLPQNMLLAGEKAKQLEMLALDIEK